MRRVAVLAVAAGVVVSCGNGLTTEQVQLQIDNSIESALATTSSIVSSSTTAPSATLSTTFPPAVSTTTTPITTPTTVEALPSFPPAQDNLEHGGETWAVILAVSPARSDPALTTAALAAQDAGYRSGVGDAACDQGTAEAVGFPEDGFYSSVSVYFDTEDAAKQAGDAFAARGIGSVVAQIVTICLD